MATGHSGNIFLTCLVLWLLCHIAPVAQSLEIGNLEHELIRAPATFYVDREGLPFPEITRREFQPLRDEHINQGISDDAFWLHFRLNNDGPAPITWLLQHETSYMDNMVVHVRDAGDSAFQRAHLSDREPFSTRPVAYGKLTYRHTTPAGDATDVYLKLYFDKPDSVSLNVHLWEETAFLEHVQQQSLLYGAYYGIFLLLMVLALITAVVARQVSAWVYALFLVATVAMWLLFNGLGFQYLWPHREYWHNEGFHLAFLGFTFLGLQFSRLFLRTAELFPRTHLLLRALQGLAVVGVGLRLAGFYEPVLHLSFALLALLAVLLPITGWRAWHQGMTSARCYTYAWCAYSLGLLLNLICAYTTWLPWGMQAISYLQIGSIAEALLLMVAMSQRLLSLDRDRRQALTMANYDPLTGLGNRRLLQWHFENLKAEFVLDRTPVYLIMIDLDHFKDVNDTYGHEAGDRVLQATARMLASQCRDSDVCIRYGGEEFAILLRAGDEDHVLALTERIRRTFANTPTVVEGQRIEHTLSAGIARVLSDRETLTLPEMMARADAALYQGKSAGRNRVILYRPPADQRPKDTAPSPQRDITT